MGRPQVLFQALLELVQQLFPFSETQLDLGQQAPVFVRMQMFEGKVLKFRLQVKYAQALGQRRVKR